MASCDGCGTRRIESRYMIAGQQWILCYTCARERGLIAPKPMVRCWAESDGICACGRRVQRGSAVIMRRADRAYVECTLCSQRVCDWAEEQGGEFDHEDTDHIRRTIKAAKNYKRN